MLRAHQKVLKAVETHGGGFDWARLSIERWRTEVAEARPFAPACGDDGRWRHAGHAGHDCAWVGASPAWRCKVRGEDSSVAAAVCTDACADTCRASLRADQACQVRALRCAGRIEL